MGVAVKVTLVPAHIIVDEAAVLTDGITEELTFIIMGLLVAVVGVAHAALLAKITSTVLPFTNVFVVNVLLLVPALTPFTRH